jgi:hypothetical protein
MLDERGSASPVIGSKAARPRSGSGLSSMGLADVLPSLAHKRLSHSWRHRPHDEFRQTEVREDIEHAIIGHASEGSGTGYGEYAITDMLGPTG